MEIYRYAYAYTSNLQKLKKPSTNCVNFSKSRSPPWWGITSRLGTTAVAGKGVAGQGRAALSSKFYSISHQEQNRVKDIIWNILNPACTRTIALCIRTYITLCTRTIALFSCCLFHQHIYQNKNIITKAEKMRMKSIANSLVSYAQADSWQWLHNSQHITQQV